ncbi:hypothetical protein AB0K43_17745 [Kitasatospora sp. NPDC049258]|uniref:hypothetical protein n=1 Tax=Kitasatospora sp. NPDC049258 TaxID=3155394 RepID=UPI00343F1717
MSGHPYGQSAPATGGPHHPGVKVLYCLVPPLTLGLLGMVPSLVLAVRRRRPVDLLGAVLFGLVQLTVYVCLGLSPDDGRGSAYSVLGGLCLFVLMLLAPAHFLLMDRARVWLAAGPQPAPQLPTGPMAAMVPMAAPAMPAAWPTPAPGWPPAPAPLPGPMSAPVPAQLPAPAPATADDLQQLGELLRRQAQEGRG